MTRGSHDPRCERSATKATRCVCQCGGNLHGVEATQIDLEYAHRRQLITDDELADAQQRLDAWREVVTQ